MNIRRRRMVLLTYIVAAIVVAVFVSLLVGDASWLIAAGAGMGVTLGVYFGNRKAREVDAYRREWLGKRASGGKGAGPDGGEDSAGDER
ncbi:hypothetical protein [Arthrobacter sp. YD2]|uniref:hypothetical protein n=1 Tax=Arthrobacter sp. YD2 TaxID=3058046 RepID=UPI0025B46F35|nr:hypothetical protein [Arthrobacter sp. YD2]MDN3905502.1 hypothetical protein [Arthrobacter sp. YD2]